MTRHKDFFELFRDNSHKLAETPTPRTWRKLERRLDAHKRHNRAQTTWTLGMLAAILALVVLVGLLSLTFESKLTPVVAVEDAGPRYLEELAVQEESSELNPVKVIEYQRHYKEKTSQIKEGTRTQKLVPAYQEEMTD